MTGEPLDVSAFHTPADLIRATLADLGMRQNEVAARAGLSAKHVNQIAQGRVPVSPEMALLLERVTGVPAVEWNRVNSEEQDRRLREREDYLVVRIELHVRLGPDSMAAWPHARCEERARAIMADAVADWRDVEDTTVHGGGWVVTSKKVTS